MLIAGKVWGHTEQLFANAAFEAHLITVIRDHRCSKHRHATKYNAFRVMAGKLLVTVWQPTGTIDITTLNPGQTLVVPPGVFHQFTAPEATVALEFYWTELHANDIEREDTGE